MIDLCWWQWILFIAGALFVQEMYNRGRKEDEDELVEKIAKKIKD